MLYRIHPHLPVCTYPVWNGFITEVDADIPSKAAKLFAENGWKGYTVIVDAYGQETHWVLSTVELSYVRPFILSDSDNHSSSAARPSGEMVNTEDLKSSAPPELVGSNPTKATQ